MTREEATKAYDRAARRVDRLLILSRKHVGDIFPCGFWKIMRALDAAQDKADAAHRVWIRTLYR